MHPFKRGEVEDGMKVPAPGRSVGINKYATSFYSLPEMLEEAADASPEQFEDVNFDHLRSKTKTPAFFARVRKQTFVLRTALWT